MHFINGNVSLQVGVELTDVVGICRSVVISLPPRKAFDMGNGDCFHSEGREIGKPNASRPENVIEPVLDS